MRVRTMPVLLSKPVQLSVDVARPASSARTSMAGAAERTLVPAASRARSTQVRELVDRSVRGDAEAFGGLYDLLCDEVHRYFYYQVGRGEDAEDLVSLTFLRAWRAMPSFQWRSRPFEAWLFTIARNQLMDFYRQRRAVLVELDEESMDSGPGPEAQTLAKLDLLRARQALSCLTTEQREVIVLKFYLNRDNTEIARLMGKREGTVRGLQMRALRALRRLLDD